MPKTFTATLHICVIMLHVCTEAAQVPSVELRNTLFRGDTAYDGQEVEFICITTSTEDILTWSSAHYIGGILQVSIHDAPGSTDSNQQNPNTVATLVNATTNDGVIVIKSRLQIRASMQYPNSSVSCQVNNNGLVETRSFRVSQPTVNLTSTLHKGDVAIDGQQVNFICITTSTDDILTWRSAHYIEGILQVSFHDAPGSTDSNQQNPNTVATLVNATSNGGVIVIESHLWIRASMQYPNCSAACQINSHGPMSIIAFQTLPELPTEQEYDALSTATPSTTEHVGEGAEQHEDDSVMIRTIVIPVVVALGVVIAIAVAIAAVFIVLKPKFGKRNKPGPYPECEVEVDG